VVPSDRDLRVAHKFSAAHAARIALSGSVPHLTPARERILRAATVLWCRHLQFPTARDIARAAGHSSVSCVVAPFGRCIDVQGAIIRVEWDLVAREWATEPDGSRPRWLAEHAVRLARVDGSCLRLPGLVCSAVAASGIALLPPPRVLVPLHALAALARPGLDDDVRTVAAAAATLAGPTSPDQTMATA
jgi:hypothetical protein